MPHQLLCEVSAICPPRSYEAAVNHVTTYSDAWWRRKDTNLGQRGNERESERQRKRDTERCVVGLLYPCASTQLPLASLCHPSDHDLGLIFFSFLASLVSCSEQVSNFTNLTIVPLVASLFRGGNTHPLWCFSTSFVEFLTWVEVSEIIVL